MSKKSTFQDGKWNHEEMCVMDYGINMDYRNFVSLNHCLNLYFWILLRFERWSTLIHDISLGYSFPCHSFIMYSHHNYFIFHMLWFKIHYHHFSELFHCLFWPFDSIIVFLCIIPLKMVEVCYELDYSHVLEATPEYNACQAKF